VYSKSYQYVKQVNSQKTKRQSVSKKSSASQHSSVKDIKKSPSLINSLNKKLNVNEQEIREILNMYFEYVVDNLPGKSKVVKIDVGKFLKKTTFGSD
jgi:hypothetical protein